MAPPPTPLPIDEILDEVVERLRNERNLVIEAPPGAGKTTRVPRALVEREVVSGEVLVLEPRRLAARLSARRVAEEMGEPVGERVGYAVRFEEMSSPRTRLRFVTQGVLLRRLLGAGANLLGVSAVILDEFHERSLEGDVALALLRRLQLGARPDLHLIAMSATLDADPIARYLGDCGRVRSEGRRFEVAVEFAAQPSEAPLEEQVAAAVRRLVAGGLDGDVLVFLPGAREIRRAEERCAPIAAREKLLVVSLHGEQSPADQDRALGRADRPKIILSTNVAETSVTIDGVVAVIDSGLARVATHAPWSGLPSLKIARVSRASAAQRAGRAGRTRPGRALRLYTRHDHDTRPEYETPEIRRADLADTVLLLRASGVTDPTCFGWFDAPPAAALAAADALLLRLGATDGHGAVTSLGRRMLRVPLHPRLARLLCEAEDRGVSGEGARVAAYLGEGRRGGGFHDASSRRAESGPSDVIAAAERDHSPTVDRARKMLARLCRKDAPRPADPDAALLQSILTAFPDRVARRRRPGAPEVLLSGGGAATLARESVVQEAELMVAVEAEEQARRETGGAAIGVLIKSASAIEADWLLDLFPDSLKDGDEVIWDARADRVRAVRRLLYDDLVLDESVIAHPDPAAVSRVLAAAALAAGPRAFLDGDGEEALSRLRARIEVAAAARPDAAFPPVDDAALREALTALCDGKQSFAELREDSLVDAVRARLDPGSRALLDRLAPDRLTLPGGRSARIEYRPGQSPSLASRLQDFFGMVESPRVGGGAIPLTIHLLAPNQRAVQVTSDLAGFWIRHYPAIRRELMRKYPKHAWPEDPKNATPPTGGRGR